MAVVEHALTDPCGVVPPLALAGDPLESNKHRSCHVPWSAGNRRSSDRPDATVLRSEGRRVISNNQRRGRRSSHGAHTLV